MLKRILMSCFIAFSLCVTFSNVHEVQAAGMRISVKQLKLYQGKKATLKIKNTRKKVTWKADDPIVKVSSKGVVTALEIGETDVKGTVGSKTFTCHVTVLACPALSDTSLSLKKGKTHQLTLEETSEKVTWRSSNRRIATVSSKGLVKAVKAGKATITATSLKAKFTCKVTVFKAPALNKTSLKINEGLSAKLSVSYVNQVDWSSSDESVATISGDGTLQAVEAGRCVITASFDDDSLQCKVTVSPALVLSDEEVELKANQTKTLKVLNALSTVSWSSANKKIATVTKKGVVKGIKKGETTITAKVSSQILKCKVTVTSSPVTNSIDKLIGSTTDFRRIAHRGYSAQYPENTVPAFLAACEESRFWGIETDIYDTKDGHFICIHNSTVDSMTDGTGKVSDFTLEELKALKVDSGIGIANYEDLHLATFEEYLDLCKRYDKIAVVEIKVLSKTSRLKQIIEIIKSHGMIDRCIITSFQTNYLKTIRNSYDANVPIMPCYMQRITSTIFNTWSDYKNCAISQRTDFIEAEYVKKFKNKNIIYAAWVIYNEKSLEETKQKGVRLFFENKPI